VIWKGIGEEANLEVKLIYGQTPGQLKNRPLEALKYYAEHDKLWAQDPEAQGLLKQLSATQRNAVLKIGRKWHPKTKQTWSSFLQMVANDQAFFRELLFLGPTAAGLVGSRQTETAPMYEKFGLSETTARRIYQRYTKQLRKCLGLGTKPSKQLHSLFKKLGLLDSSGHIINKAVTPWLNSMSAKDRERYTDVALHWFNHCLRNLGQRRSGHPALSWRANDIPCADACHKYQRELVPHLYACDPPIRRSTRIKTGR
jgi:hypothetical protein